MTIPEPRQPFTGVALAAVLGICAADRLQSAPWCLWLLLMPATALVLLRPRAITCWLFAAAAFFALHTLRFHGSAARELARELDAGPRVVRAAGIVLNDPVPPETWTRGVTCFFQLRLESLDIAGERNARDVLMNVSWPGPIPAYGDRVALTGSARNLAPTRNPGQFDFTRYQQRRGVYSEIAADFAQDVRIESHGHGSRLQSFAYAAQRWIQSRLALDLEGEPQVTSLISSMVLGMRGETPDDTKELFQRTGTLHLFAVSGLNVAMLAAIALSVLKPLRITGPPAIFITLPILAFYALVTGLSASCVRATIMAALLLLAPVFDRRAVPYNSLSAAAFLILAWDTNQLFLPGFQFSFVLVFVIVLLARRIQQRCEPFGQPDPFLPRALWSRWQSAGASAWRLLAISLGVTLSAWLGSLPFTAGYFHLFSPAAIFANLLAVPIAFVVLALGVAALIAAGFSAALAGIFNNANWLAAKALLAVVNVFAAVPGGHIYVELPRTGPAPVCELTVLDVGEGAAIHLRSGGNDWLIDCGSTWTYGKIVLPYLRARGVNRLDGLAVTHGDTQHLGGALELLDDFTPRRVADSILRDRSSTRRQLHEQLAVRALGKSLCQRGDRLRISASTSLRVLFPPAGIQRTTADDKALVVQLEAAGTRVLLMSDSGFRTEQWLLENEPDLRSDIVIKGQHASDFSGTIEFLARVAPQAVICSDLGRGRPTQPLDEWESAVIARGITVFRQDRCGAVRIALREGGAFELSGFVGGQTLRSRAR